MKISVIVPGFGSRRAEALAAAAHLRAGLAGLAAEVLVPDGVNVAAARNHGLAAAAGDWIAWVDADDEIFPEWFALVRRVAAGAYDVDCVLLAYALIFPDGRRREIPRQKCRAPSELLGELLAENQGCYCWDKIIRRDCWRDLRFDESAAVLEDALLVPQLVRRVRTLAFAPEIAYGYVVNPGGLLQSDPFGATAESVVRIALCRAADWSQTEFARAAELGAAKLSLDYLERFVLARRRPGAFASVPRRFIRRRLWTLLTGGCGWRLKVKFVCAALGCWWPQRLAWRWHRVKTAEEGER